jgi:hypothetical protein
MTILKRIIGFCIACFFIYYFSIIWKALDSADTALYVHNKTFSGVISKKLCHGDVFTRRRVLVLDKKDIGIFLNNNIFEYFQVGDSIVKYRGDSLRVFRGNKDTTFFRIYSEAPFYKKLDMSEIEK